MHRRHLEFRRTRCRGPGSAADGTHGRTTDKRPGHPADRSRSRAAFTVDADGAAATGTSPEPEPLTPASTVATKYGDMPTDYKEAITRYFQDHLRNPESIQYREITKPEQGYVTSIVGSILMREERVYGWKVKATIDATNSRAKYVGFKTYTFLFRGEKIVNALSPLPEDEMK